MATNNSAEPEQEAFIASRNKKKTKMESLSSFCYNKEDGTIMGRTGKSWAQILGFYLIFYACLAGFFAICLSVFMTTIDQNAPRWKGKGSIMGDRPGLGYQPWLIEKPDSTMIKFTPNEGENKTYVKYIERIRDYLMPYLNQSGAEGYDKECPALEENQDRDQPCSYTTTVQEAIAEFDANCAGLAAGSTEDVMENWRKKITDGNPCTFGYGSGNPTVLLSLNRMLEWKPTKYEEGAEVPGVEDTTEAETIRKHVNNGNVNVKCEGQYAADQDNIGKPEYYPKAGLSFKYFPYVKYSGNGVYYHPPLVFVQFKEQPKGVIVLVECKAYAKNVVHDRMHKLGMAHFELLVEFTKQDKEEAKAKGN